MEKTVNRLESGRCNGAENGMRINTRVNDNKNLLFAYPKSEAMSDISDDHSLIVYDVESGLWFGLLKENEMYYAAKSSRKGNRVIAADLENGSIRVYKNQIPKSARCTQGVIDLTVTGRRWEGRIKNGRPFGYGVLYDEEGKKEYEGFMIGKKRICYGREYFDDIERVKYEGGFYNNKQFGKGKLYGRNGVVEYDGLWKNSQPHAPHYDGTTIDNHTESIVISNNSLNELESFIPPYFLKLKQMIIGDDCFRSVRVFELSGLNELESVVVGERSITFAKTWEDAVNSKRTDGSYRIVNCPKLVSILIGGASFSDYHSFELTNLPSLQSIVIGDDCFRNAPSFSLTGLIG